MKHFTIKELSHSDTALAKGIDTVSYTHLRAHETDQ